MLRYLRIAAAVFFAMLAIGFVALWVRSCDHLDRRNFAVGRKLAIYGASFKGVAAFGYRDKKHYESSDWVHREVWLSGLGGFHHEFRWFDVNRGSGHRGVTLPQWFLAACSLAIAAALALGFPRRFTVRGLLIATTLIAATLGLAVYSAR